MIFLYYIPVVPARGGAEVALKIYIRPFSSIELACAVRQPSPCVRALCESCVLLHMSHVKLHFALPTSHCSLHTPHFTLHTPHCTLKTPHFTLHTPHVTLHTSHVTLHSSHSKLHTSQSTLHTSQSTLHTSHSSLLSSHSQLHTSHFTLHSSRPTLHTALFTLHTSSHLSPSHLIPAHLFSSLLICHLSFHESLPSTTTNHCRSLDAPTPIRFTIFSCKIQEYYVCSRGTKQPWRSHSNAICRDSVAKHNRITRKGIGNCSSKTGWISTPKRKKDDFEALFKRIFKRKITSAKMEKICWQSHFAAWMQPLQYDLRSSAAKDKSITYAAAASINFDAAIPMRSAVTQLQNTIELRATASETADH